MVSRRHETCVCGWGPRGKPVGAGPVVQGSYSDVFTINPGATQRLAPWPAGQAPTSTSTVNRSPLIERPPSLLLSTATRVPKGGRISRRGARCCRRHRCRFGSVTLGGPCKPHFSMAACRIRYGSPVRPRCSRTTAARACPGIRRSLLLRPQADRDERNRVRYAIMCMQQCGTHDRWHSRRLSWTAEHRGSNSSSSGCPKTTALRSRTSKSSSQAACHRSCLRISSRERVACGCCHNAGNLFINNLRQH